MGATCRDCGKEIVWLLRAEFDGTPVMGAKKNPIEVDPHPEGNLVISRDKGLYRFATGNEKEMARDHHKNLYVSHFSTCPSAEKFRTKGK